MNPHVNDVDQRVPPVLKSAATSFCIGRRFLSVVGGGSGFGRCGSGDHDRCRLFCHCKVAGPQKVPQVCFLSFLVFEFCVGVYFPSIGTLKSELVPATRAGCILQNCGGRGVFSRMVSAPCQSSLLSCQKPSRKEAKSKPLTLRPSPA